MRRRARIMLVAGGTGGHVFPAIAVLEELRMSDARARVLVVTDRRGKRYRRYFPKVAMVRVAAATVFGNGLAAKLSALFWVLLGGLQILPFLLLFRPHIIVGFGGYPSFIPCAVGRLLRMRVTIHEQNAVMGRANRLLHRMGAQLAVSFPNTQKLSPKRGPVEIIGNPVRRVVADLAEQPYHPWKRGTDFNLLVFGGSQGAHILSDIVPQAIAALPSSVREHLQVTHQASAADMVGALAHYGPAGVRAELREFFPDLPALMRDAHLVIGRAGASSVAELAALGTPSILVPLPGALDQDQAQNAARLARAQGSILIKQGDLSVDGLAAQLSALMQNPKKLTEMSQNAREKAFPNAAKSLAKLVLSRALGAKAEAK